MNPFNQMFNNEYIQQQAAQAHQREVENVLKSAQKLKDFLDSTDDIKPEYRQDAAIAFCSILNDFFRKHGQF